MGCNIHALAERRVNGAWHYLGVVFDWKYYGLYGFLADHRNYAESPTLGPPQMCIPEDASDDVKTMYGGGHAVMAHDAGWVTLPQLLNFDYEQTFVNQNIQRLGDVMTVREWLHEEYFEEVRKLDSWREAGDPESVRVVFWFDN